MINANELRLGNYVFLYNDTPVKISVIAKQVLQVDEGSGNVFSLQNVEPIPLTPEILEKTNLLNGEIFPDIEYFEIKDGSIYFEGSYTTVEVTYLHQLQNIYFALTGQELEIEL